MFGLSIFGIIFYLFIGNNEHMIALGSIISNNIYNIMVNADGTGDDLIVLEAPTTQTANVMCSSSTPTATACDLFSLDPTGIVKAKQFSGPTISSGSNPSLVLSTPRTFNFLNNSYNAVYGSFSSSLFTPSVTSTSDLTFSSTNNLNIISATSISIIGSPTVTATFATTGMTTSALTVPLSVSTTSIASGNINIIFILFYIL